MKTTNERNDTLLKLENAHARCAGKSKKDIVEARRES